VTTALGRFSKHTPLQTGRKLWYYVFKLLWLSWIISLKSFLRASRLQQFATVAIGLFGAAIGAAIFIASRSILGLIRSPRLGSLIDSNTFIAGIPASVLTGVFGITLLFSFGLLLQGLYLAGDMEFLLCTPVPIRAVFIAKLLQAILPNLAFVSLFAVPLLFGLGASAGYTLPYYPLALALLAFLMFAASGLASLLVMGIVRLFPARTVAEVTGAVGGILAFTLSLLGSSASPSGVGRGQAARGLQFLSNLDQSFSPFAWAGRGLTDIGRGNWLSGAGLMILALGLSGGIFVATWSIAERLYFSGWTRLQAGAGTRKRAKRPPEAGSSAHSRMEVFNRLVSPAMRGLILKDSLVLRRDLRSMSQLISPLILGLIYAVTFIGRDAGGPAIRGGTAPSVLQGIERAYVTYSSVALAVFVGWMLMSRMALLSFSHEGKQYWLIKSAPVSANQLLAAKFVIAYVPTLGLDWGFLLALALLHRAAGLWFALPAVALIIAGGAAIYLCFGVTGANLAWDNPRRMVSTTTGCVSTVVGAAYIVIAAALFFLPPVMFPLLGWSEAYGQLLGLGLGGMICVACAVLPLALVRAQVSRVGET
jgi:ABC-2 type transport system permease protein